MKAPRRMLASFIFRDAAGWMLFERRQVGVSTGA
jgi:hypothetical protein